MRGDLVIARSFGNFPIVRRVWDIGNGIVYICTEERFSALQAGKPILPPVGFPDSDVFEYDADKLILLRENNNAWNALIKYRFKGEKIYA